MINPFRPRRAERRAREEAARAAAEPAAPEPPTPPAVAAPDASPPPPDPRRARYTRERAAYAALPHAETLDPADDFPCLDDATDATGIDAHYVYCAHWAFAAVHRVAPRFHLDLGGQAPFLAMLAATTRVVSVDIRPLTLRVDGFVPLPANLTALPLADRSIASLSCIHVAEHVGLGRYGDPLDPRGTLKSLAEMSRVLAPGGRLLLALPVGRPRVQFNAHRIHDPEAVPGLLPALELTAFSLVDDADRFHPAAQPADARGARYACGMYTFTRPGDPGTAGAAGATT